MDGRGGGRADLGPGPAGTVVGRAADWGLGPRAVSKKTAQAGARIAGLKATESVCPYCAVGCGQVVYTRDGELVDIEGNPRSPINQGTLCPKGSASRQLIQQPGRLTRALARPLRRHRDDPRRHRPAVGDRAVALGGDARRLCPYRRRQPWPYLGITS